MFIEVLMNLLQPTLLANIVDEGVNTGNISYIIKTGIIMIAISLIGGIGGFGCTIASAIASILVLTLGQIYLKNSKFFIF